MSLVARVWASRAYVCSASSLVTNIWSIVSFESESVEQAVVSDILIGDVLNGFLETGDYIYLLGPRRRGKFLGLQANTKD